MNIELLKAVATKTASIALSVTSAVLDKGAELADNAEKYLNEKDTSGRQDRSSKRATTFGFKSKD